MKRFLQIFLLVVLGGAAWMIWAWTHPPPEKAIRKEMEKLAETLGVKAGEGNFARVGAINRALSHFTADVVINAEGVPHVTESINGKTELQQALFAARSQLEGVVSFQEIHVLVGDGETNATVNFLAAARVSGQSEPFGQDFKAQFQKVDGKWLISRVEAITLKPPTRGQGDN